jgi:hypothetical protein
VFYFAWADSDETTFTEGHARVDEDVYSINLQHAEGDFASLEVEIRNPRRGLLAPSRKRWAWLSYRKQDSTLVPLFFGRIVGVPQDVQDNIIQVSFLARPVDFTAQKAALAEAMKVSPYWDEVWLPDQEAINPDSVLEGYSSLWHIDRVTGEVTASDIITGEDGQIDFTASQVFYDSVSITYGDQPLRRIKVEATVNWQQYGSGDISITRDLLDRFRSETANGVYAADKTPRTSEGVINIIPGEEMIAAWPEFGQSIGGGWTVGDSSARVVGEKPLDPILLPNREAYAAVEHWKDFPGSPTALRTLFDRSPGFVVEIENTTKPWLDAFGWAAHGDVNVLWVPIWQIAVTMKLHWEAARDWSEVLTFTVDADVQELVTGDEEDDETILSVGPADVDGYIGDSRRDAYFRTDRGRQSLQNLLARARAHLLASARAVEVSFSVAFEDGLGLSCRKSASIVDPRIPEGIAAGKIKGYALTCDGSTGVMLATVTIGCTVGRGGTISVVPGTPIYVADGYVNTGYQEEVDSVIVPIPGELGYTLANYVPNGDGVSFYQVTKQRHLLSLEIEGGLDKQRAEAQNAGAADTPNTGTAVMDKINGYKTRVALTLRPVTGGPFETQVTPTVTALKVPRTINMEAESFAINLSGTIDADPELSGDLVGVARLSGTIDADPELSGDLVGVDRLSGSIDADPELRGDLASVARLSGTIDADPELRGAFLVQLEGAIDADPELRGRLGVGVSVSGAIDAAPELRGDLQEPPLAIGVEFLVASGNATETDDQTFTGITTGTITGEGDDYIIALVSDNDGADTAPPSVTFGGEAMTLLGPWALGTAASKFGCGVFICVAPAPGGTASLRIVKASTGANDHMGYTLLRVTNAAGSAMDSDSATTSDDLTVGTEAGALVVGLRGGSDSPSGAQTCTWSITAGNGSIVEDSDQGFAYAFNTDYRHSAFHALATDAGGLTVTQTNAGAWSSPSTRSAVAVVLRKRERVYLSGSIAVDPELRADFAIGDNTLEIGTELVEIGGEVVEMA